jgi:hypothetical protein
MESGESVESSLLLETRLRVEPRLTAVIAWGKSIFKMGATDIVMGQGEGSEKNIVTSKKVKRRNAIKEGNEDGDEEDEEVEDVKEAIYGKEDDRIKMKENKKRKNSGEKREKK